MEKQKLHALIEQTQDLFEHWDTVLNNVPFSLPETSFHTYNHCRNVLRFALMIGLNEKTAIKYSGDGESTGWQKKEFIHRRKTRKWSLAG